MREWCIPGGVGGPSDLSWQTGDDLSWQTGDDLSWQTGDDLSRHEAWKAKVARKAVRAADLWEEDVERLSEFQRLMYRDDA